MKKASVELGAFYLGILVAAYFSFTAEKKDFDFFAESQKILSKREIASIENLNPKLEGKSIKP